jgi:hypothetical protein
VVVCSGEVTVRAPGAGSGYRIACTICNTDCSRGDVAGVYAQSRIRLSFGARRRSAQFGAATCCRCGGRQPHPREVGAGWRGRQRQRSAPGRYPVSGGHSSYLDSVTSAMFGAIRRRSRHPTTHCWSEGRGGSAQIGEGARVSSRARRHGRLLG